MEGVVRKRSVSPARTRHFKRMILLDESNDDWRRTSSSSTSPDTSKASDGGSEVSYVTEKFSGFLADFLAEYSSPKSPRSPAGQAADADAMTRGSSQGGNSNADTALPPQTPNDTSTVDWRSDSADFSSDSDETEDGSSTTDDNWEDEEVETPDSPGSDIELQDGVIRRGMYITVVLSNRERSTALPCTAKVLEVHDKRGKFTVRLSKSARRATKSMFTGPRSPIAARGSPFSPRS